MLAVIDLDDDVAYILNNSEFIGPVENAAEMIRATFTRAYAKTFEHRHSLIRMMSVGVMGSDEAA